MGRDRERWEGIKRVKKRCGGRGLGELRRGKEGQEEVGRDREQWGGTGRGGEGQGRWGGTGSGGEGQGEMRRDRERWGEL